MNWSTILDVASKAGGVAVLIALVSLPWTLKKLRSDTKKTDAETVQVITDASGKVVVNLTAQLDRMQSQMDRLDAELKERKSHDLERDRRDAAQQQRLQRHELWDLSIAQQVRSLGGHVTDPPPLYPDPTPA